MKFDKKKLARFITILTSPALVGSLFLFYCLYHFSRDTDIFFKSFGVVFIFTVGLPLIFTLILVKTKKIKNFHMKERKDRVFPFGFALLSSSISILAVKYINIGPEFFRMLLTIYLMALGYIVINFLKFKLSGHTFVFTSSILVLVSFLDLKFILLLPFVVLIGWSRVKLHEHSVGEVVGGFIYSFASFIIFSLLFQ